MLFSKHELVLRERARGLALHRDSSFVWHRGSRQGGGVSWSRDDELCRRDGMENELVQRKLWIRCVGVLKEEVGCRSV